MLVPVDRRGHGDDEYVGFGKFAGVGGKVQLFGLFEFFATDLEGAVLTFAECVDAGLGFDPFWGKDIQVGAFIGAVFEILCFYQALVHQRFQTIVGFAQADTPGRWQVRVASRSRFPPGGGGL